MADSKLADLTATTSPADTDILYIVTDPGGTPADKKVTVSDLRGVSGGVFTARAVSKPAGNLTCSVTTTYGSFSTAWQVTVAVGSSQKVKLTLSAQITCSVADYASLAIYRITGGSTFLAARSKIIQSVDRSEQIILEWDDDSPGTGSITYEVLAASGSASYTLTVHQDGSPTSNKYQTGQSQLSAEAYTA